ncbi:hypothetical protein P9Y62_12460 [Bacillus thuringiensis]|uniref:Uncharacterized protein n=3 Tax=Bacillus thuringiensis TaxID=1428 RepID=A0A9W3XHE7_BACTU|nr:MULTISPECIES: hypothetical protein [Bacillus cereus group]EEM43164.1 hypothetical protein bthur0004_8950 [Bacillus thuringiensis serovar sotto str. T04001]AFQ16710.1 hypothetical protein BTG_16340 [Bacillus thuringiensis HD-771]AQY37377.1 hypothetical protein B4918_04910 [Bacillus thuringiensis]AZV64957.1 hypothetical protein DT426_04490 [Bacillus cereus]MCU5622454.1 hypothetical protein [Bacillus cereus]
MSTESKKQIAVLIIEDEEMQVQVVNDAIDDFNEDSNDYTITSTAVYSYTDSLNLLLTENFDAAIIDLNLDQTKTEESELDGNNLVDIIVNKMRIPIIVRTGNPTSFTSTQISPENSFLKIFTKDDSVDEILEQITKWYNLGLSNTLGTKGVLEYCLNKLFWEQISSNLSEWEKMDVTTPEQERALIRYTINVLNSYLEIDSESGKFEFFHPAEVYIKPPIKSELFFGDILEHQSGSQYIILTPSCEMAQSKYKKILLCKISKTNNVAGFVDAKDKYLSSQSNSKKSALEKWFRNGHSDSIGYHFLPPYSDFEGGFIDFQDIITIDPEVASFSEEYAKIATVTSQFAKDISSRFTLYYARQGQPNLNSDLIINSLIRVATEV